MGAPGIVPGGADLTSFANTPTGAEMTSGVFARFPGATPKYALNDGQGRDAEYRETMARLFIQVPTGERKQFVNSCPEETKPLAEVLCGGTGGAAGTGFIDFLLTSVNETFQEKVQVVESLSDNFVVYTFGQRAPQFQYSGTLLNTYQDDQRVWMMRLYQDLLRGTQLARRRKLARMRYDSVIVSGVFIMHTQALQGDWRDYAQFQFAFIPTQYVIFTPALGTPTTHNLDGKPLGDFTSDKAYELAPAVPADNTRFRVASAKQATYPTSAPAAAKPQTKQEEYDGRSIPKSTKDELRARADQATIDPRTGLPPSIFQGGSGPTADTNVRGGIVK